MCRLQDRTFHHPCAHLAGARRAPVPGHPAAPNPGIFFPGTCGYAALTGPLHGLGHCSCCLRTMCPMPGACGLARARLSAATLHISAPWTGAWARPDGQENPSPSSLFKECSWQREQSARRNERSRQVSMYSIFFHHGFLLLSAKAEACVNSLYL